MTNTIDNQPSAVALQATDELLLWQAGQSPPTRKLPVSGLGAYYLLLANPGSISGTLTLAAEVITGLLTAGTLTTSGTLNAGFVSGGTISAGVETLTGSLTATGAVNAGSVVATGPISGATGSISGSMEVGTLTVDVNEVVLGSQTIAAGQTVAGGSSIAGGATIDVLSLGTVLTVPNGGMGAGTFTLHSLLVGAGTSAPTGIAPGAAGNALISDGTVWAGQALSAAGVTSFNTRVGPVTFTSADLLSVQPLTYEAVGTYAFATSLCAGLTPGTTYSGASIGLSSGTWRCMGSFEGAIACPISFVNLMLRIS